MKRRTDKRRVAPFAEDGQQYARVVAMLGNGRVKAVFGDGAEHVCRIRGNMRHRRHREWVNVGDVVLVATRDDLAGDKGDIIFRYQPAEVEQLRKHGEPVVIASKDADDGIVGDDIVAFERADDDGMACVDDV